MSNLSSCKEPTVHSIDIYSLGTIAYEKALTAMHAFTDRRDASTRDQVWLCEHPPVFTQGQAGRPEHLLDIGDIPLVQSDRGGQVTYHGPGQLVAYVLLDLKRLNVKVRGLVSTLEESIVEALATHSIHGYALPDAPGVYLKDEQGQQMKIASLGLRVRRGCSFHGVAYNVDMDLSPFLRIDPCGYAGQIMTQLSRWTEYPVTTESESDVWLKAFSTSLMQHIPYQRPLFLSHKEGMPAIFEDLPVSSHR
ncbi:lipoyl(octanoyl) transferase LipB [Cernens ardua]|uniref:lipoyl(octanoyl) transferase LipB n=1 Tax=Cernens ardua TaxID=3402176 RepID=UPI003F9E609B